MLYHVTIPSGRFTATPATDRRPTCPFPAPGVDYPDFLEIIRQIARYTYIWAFAQVPSLAVPCGFSDDGLPVSMQLASRWFDEPAILRLGHAFQTVTDFHLRRPA